MQFEYKTVGGGTPSDDWTRRDWLPQYHQLGSFFKICSEYGGRGLAQIAPFKWWIGTKNTNATPEAGNVPDGIFEGYRYPQLGVQLQARMDCQPGIYKGQRVHITDKYWQNGWLFPAPTKFFFAHDDDLTHTGSYRDRMKFRLSETHLLLAEAYLGLNDADNAAKAVNVVRNRAKASSVSAAQMDMDFLASTSIRELVGEEAAASHWCARANM